MNEEEVFELCMLEEDKEIAAFSKDATLLAIIAPHVPYRMSPYPYSKSRIVYTRRIWH